MSKIVSRLVFSNMGNDEKVWLENKGMRLVVIRIIHSVMEISNDKRLRIKHLHIEGER